MGVFPLTQGGACVNIAPSGVTTFSDRERTGNGPARVRTRNPPWPHARAPSAARHPGDDPLSLLPDHSGVSERSQHAISRSQARHVLTRRPLGQSQRLSAVIMAASAHDNAVSNNEGEMSGDCDVAVITRRYSEYQSRVGECASVGNF